MPAKSAHPRAEISMKMVRETGPGTREKPTRWSVHTLISTALLCTPDECLNLQRSTHVEIGSGAYARAPPRYDMRNTRFKDIVTLFLAIFYLWFSLHNFIKSLCHINKRDMVIPNQKIFFTWCNSLKNKKQSILALEHIVSFNVFTQDSNLFYSDPLFQPEFGDQMQMKKNKRFLFLLDLKYVL